MATNFGYVERTADSFVNWAEVSKTMTDTLYEVERRREEKKAILDKNEKDALDYFKSSIPTGESPKANSAALDLCNNAQQILLDASRKMRSGEMSPTQFMKVRENMYSGVKDAYSALVEYQKKFAENKKRVESGEASNANVDNLAWVESFGDFEKSGFYINPYTGDVALAKKKDITLSDGSVVQGIGDNPNEVASSKSLLNLINTQINKYNYDEDINSIVDKLGKDSRMTKSGGFLRFVEDITQKKYYKMDETVLKDLNTTLSDEKNKLKTATGADKKAIQDNIKRVEKAISDYKSSGTEIFNFNKFERESAEARINDPYKRVSILVDRGVQVDGKDCQITSEDVDINAPGNEHLIKRKIVNGIATFEFSDKAKEASVDFMVSNMRSKYDYSESSQQLQSNYRPTSEAEARTRKLESSLATNFARALMSTDDKIKENAIRAIGNALIESGRPIANITWDAANNQIKWTEQGATGISGSINVASSGGGLGTLKDIIGQGSIFGFSAEPSEALKQAGEFSRRGGEAIVKPSKDINVQYTITSPAATTGAAGSGGTSR